MAIVINEFEAVAEAPAQRTQSQDNAEDAGSGAKAALEGHDLAAVIQVLAQRALRSWAH